MDTPDTLGVLAALGFLGGVFVTAAMGVHRSRRGTIAGLSRSASRRVAARLEEIAAGAPVDEGAVDVVPQPAAHVPLGPRRRLWRDTSAALAVLGALVLVVLIVDPKPGGAVLDATGLPGPSLRVIAFVSPSLHPSLTAGLETTAEQAATPTPRTKATQLDVTTPAATAVPGQPGGTARLRDTSDRMAVLTPCSRRPDCYVYVVRQGDNLTSITNWFGVPYSTVLRLNPQIDDPRDVHAGDRIRLPTPGR